jgi:Rrf2 family protein
MGGEPLKISAKSRYALAALVQMGMSTSNEETVAIASLSESLGISKIYLEQVFSLLKRGNIVTSTKGAMGGYRLARSARDISALDILTAIEISLFEKVDPTVADRAPAIEHALTSGVFDELDAALPEVLKKIKLIHLINAAEEFDDEGFMYYL